MSSHGSITHVCFCHSSGIGVCDIDARWKLTVRLQRRLTVQQCSVEISKRGAGRSQWIWQGMLWRHHVFQESDRVINEKLPLGESR